MPIDSLTGAVGSLASARTGQPPTLQNSGPPPGGQSAASSLTARFNSVFDTTFDSTLVNVATRGANGEFDDPSFRLQEHAALARLRAAQERATARPAAPPADAGLGAGASAAPDAATIGGGPGPALGADETVTAQRELYAVRVGQSEARLKNISASLNAEFPAAAQLQSASTGTWDPETFVPKTREEAEAFAQRMVIDATESAARLEIVKTQLDAALFEADTTGSPAALALARELQADFDRQMEYVDKLARIVDSASDGAVSDAGVDAMAGITARDLQDLPVEDIVAALRAAGMDEASIERVIGAGELGVQEEKTPGGSPVLRKIAADAALWTWQHRERLREARNEFERERADQRRADDRRVDERRAERRSERRRMDERVAEKQRAERQQSTARAHQHREQENAEFRAWLDQLRAKSAQRRTAG